MAITNKTDLELAISKRESIPFYMASLTTVAGTTLYNPYQTASMSYVYDSPNIAVTTPATIGAGGTSYSNGSHAAYNLNHSGYSDAYIESIEYYPASNLNIEIHDRIWSCSGIDITSTANQTIVGFPTITRNTENDYLMLYVEIYTTLVSSATVLTIYYLDLNSNAKYTTVSIPANAVKGTMIPVYLGNVTPDNGKDIIKSITSVVNSVAGTSGSFGLTVTKKLGVFSNNVNVQGGPVPVTGKLITKDWSDMGLIKIHPNACLNFLYHPTGTSSGISAGKFNIARA